MQDFSIDVVIPYRNNFRRLILLVDELINLKHLGKIIVVRDYCSQPSPTGINKSPVEIIENTGIQGALSARYTGVHHSTADYILFFDSDDIYVGGSLSDLNLDSDVIVSNYVVNKTLKETEKYMDLRLFAHNLTLVPFSGLIVKRQSLLEAENNLDLGIKSCQDDLLVACLMFGKKTFVHSNSTLAHISTSPDSISVLENRFKDIEFILRQFRTEISSNSLFGSASLLIWKGRLFLGKWSPKICRIYNRFFFSKYSF